MVWCIHILTFQVFFRCVHVVNGRHTYVQGTYTGKYVYIVTARVLTDLESDS